jgi:hypothetical protein
VRELSKNDGDIHVKWSSGCGQFFEFGDRPWMVWIGVPCRLHNLPEDRLAMLDTGAEWSMVGGELAEEFWTQLEDGEPFPINARGSVFDGELRRANITLRAQNGEDLTLSGTLWLCKEWPGPIVLGYQGLFERIRFALDPGSDKKPQLFYFGSSE